MPNKSILVLLFASLLCLLMPLPSPGAVAEYMLPNGVVPVKVASSTPLPIAFYNPSTGATSGGVPVTGITDSGILGSATLSIPLSAVALPTAPTGATKCYIFPTQDVNWGNTSVAAGTDHQYFFQLIPGQGFFGVTDFTSFRLIGRTAVATATIIWR